MWYLPNQTITISFKDAGLSAGQVATFFAITTVPWLIKPVYGLLSDFVPLFGFHRKSYLMLTSATAAAAGILLGVTGEHSYSRMAILFTGMAIVEPAARAAQRPMSQTASLLSRARGVVLV